MESDLPEDGYRLFPSFVVYSGGALCSCFLRLCLGVWLYFRAQVSQPQESTLAAISMDTICPGYKQAYIELKSGERIALGKTGNKQEKRIEGWF